MSRAGDHQWFWSGISAAAGLAASSAAGLVWTLSGCAAVLAVSHASRRLRRAGLRRYALLCALFAAYFQVYDGWHLSALKPLAAAEASVWAEGRIASPVNRDGDSVRFFAVLERYGQDAPRIRPAPRERVAVRLKLERQAEIARVEAWRKGDRIAGRLSLSLPDGARNPHGFDYARYLRWQGVWVVAAASAEDVRVTPDGRSLGGWMDEWQKRAGGIVDRTFADRETAGYMKSLLLGIEDGVPPELAEAYADLGLIHVLAISGLHVTLVCALFAWGLEQAGLSRRHVLLATGAFLASYVMLVGASASAVRAGLMGGIGLWAAGRNRAFPASEAWGASLFAMLAFNPYQLWHIGFQLSFAVTLGLILYVPLLESFSVPRTAWLRTALAVTTAAQLVSFPFLVYWFHQASPLSWVVNLIAAPVLSLAVLPLGYTALLTGAVHPALAWVPARLAEGVLAGVHAVLMWMHPFPIPFRHWPHPHAGWLVAYAGFLVVAWAGWRLGYHRRRDVLVWGACLMMLLAAARQPFAGHGEVRITFLDVGQGDSIVVEIGRKTVYLIDGGGTIRFQPREPWRERRDPFDVGEDVLLPYLRSRGIERIDRLVITHGDQDHVGGLSAVVESFPVEAVLVNGREPEGGERALLESLRERGVPVLTGKEGAVWSDAPGVRWTWLHPDRGEAAEGNHGSVVLMLDAYGTRVLFTGDLEREGEERLLKRGLLKPVDVLKVAHHGSSTSSSEAFLRHTQPKVAVISVGRDNLYHHPSADVIRRLEDVGARVFRTDQLGAVTLTIRPEGLFWAAGRPLPDR